MNNAVKIHLEEFFFTEKERVLLEYENLTVSCFRFDSAVSALRVKNDRGEFVLLPYQGQQIWSARFDGRDIAMKSIFDKPVETQEYFKTYGGFFLHCGATVMGVPSKEDDHPLHGELPNAKYQSAYVSAGTDTGGAYIEVGGSYNHKTAFNHNYTAVPAVKIYSGSAVLDVSIKITNLKKTEMELMYLGHINFRPADNAALVYSADYTPENVRVKINVPEHIKTSVPIEEFKAFLHKLQTNPELHHKLSPELLLDPEVLFSIDYKTDKSGMAHNMQVHPDGSADYAAHYPAQLDKAIRWIARTPDHDAMGLVLPANSGTSGYLAEKSSGNIKTLAAGETVCFNMKMGVLNKQEAKEMESVIEKIKAL